MKLWAIADLHLRHDANRHELAGLAPRPDDWLILAGEVGETLETLRFALETLTLPGSSNGGPSAPTARPSSTSLP